MTICPNCKHEEMPGVVFCSECGSQLIFSDEERMKTQTIHTDGMSSRQRPANFSAPISINVNELNTWATLHLVDSGQVLPLNERSEYTLGRISDAQPVMPDIDLTPFNAYNNGVSRLHAVVKHINKNIFIMDLGSANGTYLNGLRLSPNTEQSIKTGDIIALGKLKIQVLIAHPSI